MFGQVLELNSLMAVGDERSAVVLLLTHMHIYRHAHAHMHTHTHTHTNSKPFSRAEQLPAVLRSGVTGMGPASYKWLGMLMRSQMGQGRAK